PPIQAKATQPPQPPAPAMPSAAPQPAAVAPAPLTEAEALLSQLTRSFDPQVLHRLGRLLRRVKGESPGAHVWELIRRAGAVAEAAARQPVALFRPLPGGSSRPDPARAAALTWLALLSLWGRPAGGA